MALLAGADRVEGTLLGNGERTGNVDILTLALNMTTQGIDSALDFSNVNEILDIVEEVTEIDTHIRHPYVGQLVYTAFSGSHQDAINKGLAYQTSKENPLWEVPYLPIDPSDVGRSYEDIIRINSQSGKGGIAYILENKFGYELPKTMHPEVGRIVQAKSDLEERELSTSEIVEEFEKSYIYLDNPKFEFKSFKRKQNENGVRCKLEFQYLDEVHCATESGNGILNACKKAISTAFKENFEIVSFHEHSRGTGSEAVAVAYIQIQTDTFDRFYGVGIDTDTTKASIKAMFSALNRAF
jgi:2-isopropylmalate synthase